MSLKRCLWAAAAALLTFAATPVANANSLVPSAKSVAGRDAGNLVTKVHSLEVAEDQLAHHGFYNISVERASLPYSFIACKHGTRFHLHVNYYGGVEEADEIGTCQRYGNDDDGYRPRRHAYGYNDYRPRRYYRSGYGNGSYRPNRYSY